MSWPALDPHPYLAFYESVRHAATGDADDRSLVALAGSLCKAEALRITPLRITPLGADLQARLSCTVRESYKELQRCLAWQCTPSILVSYI